MTLGAALRQGTELLGRGGIHVPRLTAEVLLAHAIHRDRAYLYAHDDQRLREVEWIHYGRYLHERLKNKPTQYITLQQEFFGRTFRVTPDVLIPRPETEQLIEVALPLARNARRIVDVGTGSGAIAVTLAIESGRRVFAIDLSSQALEVARANAIILAADVIFLRADSLTAWNDASADLIVSNPPYVATADRETLQAEVRDWEPALALFAGATGLDFYRRLIPEATRVLQPGASLIVELGAGQAAAVAALLGGEWESPVVTPDLSGIERVLSVRKKF